MPYPRALSIWPRPATADRGLADERQGGLTVTEGATTDKVLLAVQQQFRFDYVRSERAHHVPIPHRFGRHRRLAARLQRCAREADQPLEPGYEDLTGLFPHDMSETQTMTSYFGTYLTTVDLVVTAQWQPMAETIKQQIEQLPRPSVNLEVVSDEEYAKRIQDGTWN